MPSHIDPGIFVHANIGEKPIVFRCMVACSVDNDRAVGLLVKLWGKVAQYHQSAMMGEVSDEQIETWVGWRGKRGRFAAFVREATCDADGRLNEWADWGGKLALRREKDRDRQRKSRGQSRDGHSDSHAENSVTSRDSHNIEVRSKSKPRADTRSAPFMGPVRTLWRTRFDADPPPQAVKALRPLVEKHGEIPVLTRLETYLDRTEARFVDLFRFATTFGDWEPKGARGANGFAIDDAATVFAKLGI